MNKIRVNSVGEEDRHAHQRFCHSTVRGEVRGVSVVWSLVHWIRWSIEQNLRGGTQVSQGQEESSRQRERASGNRICSHLKWYVLEDLAWLGAAGARNAGGKVPET